MKAPFPWFGGKSRVAPVVWRAFGDVPNYVEPFFGSGAVLLNRPHEPKIETVNDIDGFVCNAWRAIAAAPDEVARWADWPVNENDLHARNVYLANLRESFRARLEGDPDYYDAKIAGWWLWGMACWIGGGFATLNGPWQTVNGQLVHLGNAGQGVQRRRVHLGNAGQGVQRQLVHLGNAGQGVKRQLVHLGNAGQGVQRQLVHLGNAGQGDAGNGEQGLLEWMRALSERMRHVRIASGDWSRVVTPVVTYGAHGLTGVFLDPPYSAAAGRDNDIYSHDSTDVAHECREWCEANGDNPLLRIALCGYEGEGHDGLVERGWKVYEWQAGGGYAQGNGNGQENRKRERIWFSPSCLPFDARGASGQIGLFDDSPAPADSCAISQPAQGIWAGRQVGIHPQY